MFHLSADNVTLFRRIQALGEMIFKDVSPLALPDESGA